MAGRLRGDDAGGMTENTTQSAPPEGPSFLDDTFDRLRRSGYERDTDARWFGACAPGWPTGWASTRSSCGRPPSSSRSSAASG